MPLSMMTRRLSVTVSVVPISVLLIYVGAATASAATTPPTPTATAIRPDPTLPIVFLVASIIAIAAALYFALRYHKLLIGFMETALAKHAVVYDSSTVHAMRELGAAPLTTFTHEVIGAATASPGQEMVFTIHPPITSAGDDPVAVTWSVDNKTAPGFTEGYLTHTFMEPGDFKVEASAANATISPFTVAIKAASSSTRPSLPFAIENWGRLVIVLFGLGVVGSLMAIGVLSTDAGAGLLGAMLGIGAATVATGSGKEKASDGDTPTPNPDKK